MENELNYLTKISDNNIMQFLKFKDEMNQSPHASAPRNPMRNAPLGIVLTIPRTLVLGISYKEIPQRRFSGRLLSWKFLTKKFHRVHLKPHEWYSFCLIIIRKTYFLERFL